MERVVVGVDFSAGSREVVEWASCFVDPAGRVVLVHVVPADRLPGFLREVKQALSSQTDAAEAGAMERLEELGRASSREVMTRVARGRPADVLARTGKEMHADLLAIGPRGFRAARLGTTAEQLVRMADRPVLVVHDPPPHDPLRLLLAIDSSPRSAEVLDWGRRLMERFGARATVLHVLDHVLLAGLRAGEAGPQKEAAVERAIAAARDWVAERARHHGLPAEDTAITAVFGSPVHEIAVRTKKGHDGGHDLVVTGSRGLGGVRREIFGSVASGVLRAAWCPILVV